jgi:hypothetical protein
LTAIFQAKNMGALLSIFSKLKKKKDIRVLLIGLDNAGEKNKYVNNIIRKNDSFKTNGCS